MRRIRRLAAVLALVAASPAQGGQDGDFAFYAYPQPVTSPWSYDVFYFQHPATMADVDFESTASYVHLVNLAGASASYDYKWEFHIHYSEQEGGTNHWADRQRSANWPNWIWTPGPLGEYYSGAIDLSGTRSLVDCTWWAHTRGLVYSPNALDAAASWETPFYVFEWQ